MNDLSELFDIQMVLVSLTGIVLTYLFAPPGRYTIGGPITIDPFYGFILLFAVLGCWSGVNLWRGNATDRQDGQEL